MQINNQLSANQLQSTERPLELKQGELYNAQIKERVSDTEAIIQIRGKEVKATFEGQVPAEDRVTVQVAGQKDQSVLVKTIATDTPKSSTVQAQSNDVKVLQSVGITAKDAPELKQSVQMLLDKGMPVTKEAVQELRDFFEKAQGSAAAKLDTVRALVNKRLEVTQSHLRPIHEALHGRPLNEVLTDLAKSIDPEFDLAKNEQKEIDKQLAQQKTEGASNQTNGNGTKQAGVEARAISNNQTAAPSVKDKQASTSTQAASNSQPSASAIKTEQTSTLAASADRKLSELLEETRNFVEKAPNLKLAIEKVKSEIIKNPAIDRDLVQRVEQAVVEAEKLQSIGKERLVQALKNAEEQLLKKEQQSTRISVNQGKASEGASLRETTPREIVKAVKEEVVKTPNLQRSIDSVQKLIVENQKIPAEVINKVRQAVDEANQLQQQGRITAGKETLVNALNEAEMEIEAVDSTGKNQQQVKQGEAPSQVKLEQQQVDSKAQQMSEVVSQVKEEVQRDPNLQRAIEKVREQVVNNPKIAQEVARKIEKAVNEARQLQQLGRENMGRERLTQALDQAEKELKQMESRQQPKVEQPAPPQPDRRMVEQPVSETVKQVKEEVQRDPNLQRAIEKVRDQIVNNPKMDREVAEKIEKAVSEARQLQQLGRENMGRERLTQALDQAEKELKQMESRQQPKVEQPAPPQPDRRTVEQPSSETVKQVKEEVQRDANLQRAIEKVRDQVVNNPKIAQEVAGKIEKAVSEARQLQQFGRENMGRERLTQALDQVEKELKQMESRQQPKVEQPAPPQPDRRTVEQPPSETVKQVKEEVQRDANLQRAIEKVREQVVNNPKIAQEVAEKIEKAVNEARQLQQLGRENMGRERLTQALDQAEKELKQMESRQQPKVEQPAPPQPDRRTVEQPPSETVKQVEEAIQSEEDLQKAVEKIRSLIADNKKIDSEIRRTIERFANQANQLEQAGRERITKVLEQIEKTIKQIESHTGTTNQTQALPVQLEKTTLPQWQIEQQANSSQVADNLKPVQQQNTMTGSEEKSPSEIIKKALAQIQKEPNLEKALNQIRREISSNPNLDLKTVEKVEQSIDRSSKLLDKGRELGARQQITNTLTEIQQDLAKIEPMTEQQKAAQDVSEQFDINEQLQTLPLQSKNILVTKVTQKLAQATQDFREIKREITRNLDSVERLIDLFKKNAYPQAKQILETTINKLDNAILKSDMMLFTDMRTEKQLMQASTHLADAKKLLAKGHHAEAAKIVHEIKTLIDKINFKPSEQKVMHFVSKESMNLEQKSPQQRLLNHFDETARSSVRQEPSARQMYEMVRSLGLNHDSDLAKSLVFQKSGEAPFQQSQDQQSQEQQQNLKAALMKLVQTGADETTAKIAQQAEQALNNLTGQQLLSKSDSGNTLQSMFFNLPVLLGEKPENLQVFVNSKNEGQQVDWENCNLYFLIETKKLGDVGIMLSTTERNLSITIKNDKQGFKQKMEPIAAITKEKLQEIGYNVNNINFTRMTPVNSQSIQRQHQETNAQQEQTKTRPVFTEKGMDFKI